MPWPDPLLSVPMARVGLVAPQARFRRVLVETADLGVFEPDPPDNPAAASVPTAGTRGQKDQHLGVAARLCQQPCEITELAASGRHDLAAGETQLIDVAARATRTEKCAVLTGWMFRGELERLRTRIGPLGGSLVELEARRGVTAPTAHVDGPTTGALRPLVSTYGTVPYRDVDPTWFAALAYMFMFGMMFGDVGHGLALTLLGAVTLRASLPPLQRVRPVAPFLVGAGLASIGFGFLYGEAFGPTELVPTLWLRPLEEPEQLLLTGLVVGSCLLTFTFVLATVNRWREGGASLALYATSGIGGSLLFAGAAGLVGGLVLSTPWLWQAGVALASGGVILTFVGFVVHAGTSPSGIAQAVVEMFDTILRLGSNIVSFTRLAAFGLTHAVITGVVWSGTAGLWTGSGLLRPAAAVVLFVAGNILAFALGALVGAIQALRLEYYEMFSRLFVAEGRPFEPWHLPVERSESP